MVNILDVSGWKDKQALNCDLSPPISESTVCHQSDGGASRTKALFTSDDMIRSFQTSQAENFVVGSTWSVNSIAGEAAVPKVPSKHRVAGLSNTGAYTIPAPGALRLNKFVRRLHDMLVAEKDKGVVEWRKGLLVLHNTDTFAKTTLPKYFNTRNFKTFRRQLNYYGFVHVRSFSATGATTTALWVNQDLARKGSESIASVLLLKRVNPCPDAKTSEGRRVRKEEAFHSIEDIAMNAQTIPLVKCDSKSGIDQPVRATAPCVSSYCQPQQQIEAKEKQTPVDPCNTSSDVGAKLLLMLSRSLPIMT